jgi:hypothetical protein
LDEPTTAFLEHIVFFDGMPTPRPHLSMDRQSISLGALGPRVFPYLLRESRRSEWWLEHFSGPNSPGIIRRYTDPIANKRWDRRIRAQWALDNLRATTLGGHVPEIREALLAEEQIRRNQNDFTGPAESLALILVANGCMDPVVVRVAEGALSQAGAPMRGLAVLLVVDSGNKAALKALDEVFEDTVRSNSTRLNTLANELARFGPRATGAARLLENRCIATAMRGRLRGLQTVLIRLRSVGDNP